MENLDIEKLERKTIYKVPDHFFEEMQMKVITEIAPKKEAKIIKMNWVYSAAAAAAMIFGVTFLVNQKEDNTTVIQTTNLIAKTQNNEVSSSPTVIKHKKQLVNIDPNKDLILNNPIESNPIERKTLTTAVEEKQIVKAIPKNNPSTQNSDAQVDQIVASFTSADLADLSKNVEQDVYLDLYN